MCNLCPSKISAYLKGWWNEFLLNSWRYQHWCNIIHLFNIIATILVWQTFNVYSDDKFSNYPSHEISTQCIVARWLLGIHDVMFFFFAQEPCRYWYIDTIKRDGWCAQSSQYCILRQCKIENCRLILKIQICIWHPNSVSLGPFLPILPLKFLLS